jgi:hypothetical protein
MYEVYRDGITERSSIPVKTWATRDGHQVEEYEVDNAPRFFVTLSGSFLCAHGSTVAEAVADARWKDEANRPGLEELAREIKQAGPDRLISLNEFRHLTGACRAGCLHALRNAGLPNTPMTATDIRDKVDKQWGEKLLDILENA